MPTTSKYGLWPRSGEIDLLSGRGNVKYGDKVQLGVERVESSVTYGYSKDPSTYQVMQFSRNNATVNYHEDYHKFEFVWDESGMKYYVDGYMEGDIPVGNGFWAKGGFKGENPWKSATKMAPFDQEV